MYVGIEYGYVGEGRVRGGRGEGEGRVMYIGRGESYV